MSYTEYLTKSDACGKLAYEFYQKGETDLSRFYLSASIGFKSKADKESTKTILCPESKKQMMNSMQSYKMNILQRALKKYSRRCCR